MNLQKSPSATNTIGYSSFRPNSPFQGTPNHSIDDLKQREKLYLDIIVDLTNKNKELEHEVKTQMQYICELESQMREVTMSKSSMNDFKNHHHREVIQSQEHEHLQTPPVDNIAHIEIKRLKTDTQSQLQSSELLNNSSHFLSRMVNVLDQNFGSEEQVPLENTQGETISRLPSQTKTQSVKSIGDEGISQRNILSNQTETAHSNEFSAKNIQRRNIYISPPTTPPNQESSYPQNFQQSNYPDSGHYRTPVYSSELSKPPSYPTIMSKRLSTQQKENSKFYGELTIRLEEVRQKGPLNRDQYLKTGAIVSQQTVSFLTAPKIYKYI